MLLDLSNLDDSSNLEEAGAINFRFVRKVRRRSTFDDDKAPLDNETKEKNEVKENETETKELAKGTTVKSEVKENETEDNSFANENKAKNEFAAKETVKVKYASEAKAESEVIENESDKGQFENETKAQRYFTEKEREGEQFASVTKEKNECAEKEIGGVQFSNEIKEKSQLTDSQKQIERIENEIKVKSEHVENKLTNILRQPEFVPAVIKKLTQSLDLTSNERRFSLRNEHEFSTNNMNEHENKRRKSLTTLHGEEVENEKKKEASEELQLPIEIIKENLATITTNPNQLNLTQLKTNKKTIGNEKHKLVKHIKRNNRRASIATTLTAENSNTKNNKQLNCRRLSDTSSSILYKKQNKNVIVEDNDSKMAPSKVKIVHKVNVNLNAKNVETINGIDNNNNNNNNENVNAHNCIVMVDKNSNKDVTTLMHETSTEFNEKELRGTTRQQHQHQHLPPLQLNNVAVLLSPLQDSNNNSSQQIVTQVSLLDAIKSENSEEETIRKQLEQEEQLKQVEHKNIMPELQAVPLPIKPSQILEEVSSKKRIIYKKLHKNNSFDNTATTDNKLPIDITSVEKTKSIILPSLPYQDIATIAITPSIGTATTTATTIDKNNENFIENIPKDEINSNLNIKENIQKESQEIEKIQNDITVITSPPTPTPTLPPPPPPQPPRAKRIKKKVIIKREARRLSVSDTGFFRETTETQQTEPLSNIETLEKPISYISDDESNTNIDNHEQKQQQLEEQQEENEESNENEILAEEPAAPPPPKPLKTCLKLREFQVGDWVMYAERYKKTMVRWKKGCVIERITSISYKLDIDGKEVPAHISYIKKYTDRKVSFGGKEYLEIKYEHFGDDDDDDDYDTEDDDDDDDNDDYDNNKNNNKFNGESRKKPTAKRNYSIWNMV